MRLAILADVHGNLPAFEAALDYARQQRPDQIVIAGDLVVGAPDSAACWHLATSSAYPIVRGNHERYVAQFDQPDAPPIWQTEQFGPVRWAVAQFSAAERAAIEHLPAYLRLDNAPDLLIVHASLRNDRDTIAAYTPDAEIALMFPAVGEHTIVRAHNHAPQVRLWNGRMIVTTGSVGLPLDSMPTAQYLLLERSGGDWRIMHQSVPYDLEASARRFHESGYLDAVGPIARLYLREVMTASGQIVPFLRAYRRWQAAGPITLHDAVVRFLQAP